MHPKTLHSLNKSSRIVAAVVGIALVATGAMCGAYATALHAAPSIIIEDQETGQEYFRFAATDDEPITMKWIHSIEKEPWVEYYTVHGDHLQLDAIDIKSYGAGVPADPGGVTTVKDGVIHTEGINRTIPELTWAHSHDTHTTLTVGTHVIAPTDLPHHALVRLRIQE